MGGFRRLPSGWLHVSSQGVFPSLRISPSGPESGAPVVAPGRRHTYCVVHVLASHAAMEGLHSWSECLCGALEQEALECDRAWEGVFVVESTSFPRACFRSSARQVRGARKK